MRVAVFLLGIASIATGLAGARDCLTMPTAVEVCTLARASGVREICADGRATPERASDGRPSRLEPVRT